MSTKTLSILSLLVMNTTATTNANEERLAPGMIRKRSMQKTDRLVLQIIYCSKSFMEIGKPPLLQRTKAAATTSA